MMYGSTKYEFLWRWFSKIWPIWWGILRRYEVINLKTNFNSPLIILWPQFIPYLPWLRCYWTWFIPNLPLFIPYLENSYLFEISFKILIPYLPYLISSQYTSSQMSYFIELPFWNVHTLLTTIHIFLRHLIHTFLNTYPYIFIPYWT